MSLRSLCACRSSKCMMSLRPDDDVAALLTACKPVTCDLTDSDCCAAAVRVAAFTAGVLCIGAANRCVPVEVERRSLHMPAVSPTSLNVLRLHSFTKNYQEGRNYTTHFSDGFLEITPTCMLLCGAYRFENVKRNSLGRSKAVQGPRTCSKVKQCR